MESIYYVLSWLCHRSCPHCYEDRFRPYYGEDLAAVAGQAKDNFTRIISNFPARMTFFDTSRPLSGGGYAEGRGRIILSGGEVLLEPVREPVLYPALELLRERYRDAGGVDLIVQTTGDLVTPSIIDELCGRGVSVISIAGIDSFHAGLEQPSAQQALVDKLSTMFTAAGLRPQEKEGEGPSFHFFGAQPGSWIGKLWPRGRAMENELSEAGITDNFCNQWSGGLHFLARKWKGSEVSVDPEGNVYPCCIKTKKALGNLMDESLDAMLDRLQGNPVYEAISMGHPERMGISHGWSVEKFLEKSETRLPSGRSYRNLCIGCDAFHEEVLTASRDFVHIT